MAKATRPTIRDVAAAAGVSAQTVSRVMNNHPDVAPETLERVQEVIRELGYAPNMLARGLTQGRSHQLGLVGYGLDYFGPSRIVSAVERTAAEMGYGISLTLILEPERVDAEPVLSGLRARQVDGIIWAIPEVGDNRIWSRVKGVDAPGPVLLVGGMSGRATVPSILIDNVAIGRLATQHLLDGGARHIGVVTGPLEWWEAKQRLAGWRNTIEAAGREAEECLIVEGDWTVASGEEALYRMLEMCPDIDAVFASNDQMALGVLHAAHRLGKIVPDDIAVVGVDNIAEASHFWPPLTTVRQPLAESGVLAVKALDRLIERALLPRRSPEPVSEPIVLEPELIVRESSRRVELVSRLPAAT
jgi:LacI family transcriptional regulator